MSDLIESVAQAILINAHCDDMNGPADVLPDFYPDSHCLERAREDAFAAVRRLRYEITEMAKQPPNGCNWPDGAGATLAVLDKALRRELEKPRHTMG